MYSILPPDASHEDDDRLMIPSHFLNLVVFSVLVGVFFAFLTQNTTRDRVRIMVLLGGAMIVLSLIIAYVMYPFPMRS